MTPWNYSNFFTHLAAYHRSSTVGFRWVDELCYFACGAHVFYKQQCTCYARRHGEFSIRHIHVCDWHTTIHKEVARWKGSWQDVADRGVAACVGDAPKRYVVEGTVVWRIALDDAILLVGSMAVHCANVHVDCTSFPSKQRVVGLMGARWTTNSCVWIANFSILNLIAF